MSSDADSIRTRSVEFLRSSLPSHPTLGETLESAIFAKHGQTTSNEYRHEVRSLGLTLKKENPELAQRLCAGQVTVEQVLQLDSEDLKSTRQREQDDQLRQQGMANSIGVDEFQTDVASTTQPVVPPAMEADAETFGEAEDAEMGGGGEGEFKARAQPKVGEAMKGVEFETGM